MTRLLKSTARFLTARTSLNVALEFRQWELFGLSMMIPSFSFVAKICEERVELLRTARRELATCPRCHKLLSMKAGRSFLMHLQDHHKIEAEASYELIADVYRRMLVAYQSTSVARNDSSL